MGDNEDEETLAIQAGRATKDLVTALVQDGYDISEKKSVYLTNSSTVARVMQNTMKAVGVNIKQVEQAVDLGLDVAWRRRSQQKVNSRRAQAMKTQKRINRLVRGLRRRIHRAHVIPKVMYAAEVMGVAPTLLKKHRYQVAKACGLKTAGCVTTMLAIHDMEMATDLRWKAAMVWLDRWRSKPDKHQEWREAWNHHKKRIDQITRREDGMQLEAP